MTLLSKGSELQLEGHTNVRNVILPCRQCSVSWSHVLPSLTKQLSLCRTFDDSKHGMHKLHDPSFVCSRACHGAAGAAAVPPWDSCSHSWSPGLWQVEKKVSLQNFKFLNSFRAF